MASCSRLLPDWLEAEFDPAQKAGGGPQSGTSEENVRIDYKG